MDNQDILIKKESIKELRKAISQIKNQILEQENFLDNLFYFLDNSDNKEEAFRAAVSIIDSAAQKGVIHKNAAARKKSRLNANVNAAIAKAKAAEAKEKAEAAKEEAKEAYKEKMEEKA